MKLFSRKTVATRLSCAEVVTTFGKFIEDANKLGSKNRPTELPYDVEIIKASLVDVASKAEAKEVVDICREGFCLLFDYVPIGQKLKTTNIRELGKSLEADAGNSGNGLDLAEKFMVREVDRGMDLLESEFERRLEMLRSYSNA